MTVDACATAVNSMAAIARPATLDSMLENGMEPGWQLGCYGRIKLMSCGESTREEVQRRATI